MNKQKNIKLNYGVTYNWFYELTRVIKFKYWKFIEYREGYLSLPPLHYITEFPKEICQYNNLDIILAPFNKIKKIPKELFRLTNLQQLSFYGNQIKNDKPMKGLGYFVNHS